MLSAKKLLYHIVDELPTLVLTTASFSSLPQTVTDTRLKSGYVVMKSVLPNPSAQTSDWTVETSNGSLTISGSISGSTTVTLYLMKSRDGTSTSTIKRPTIVRTWHYTKSVSASSKNYATGVIDVTWDGYTPIGVIQWQGADNTVDYWVTRAIISGNNLNFTVRANTSGTWTVAPQFDVLYVPSD